MRPDRSRHADECCEGTATERAMVTVVIRDSQRSEPHRVDTRPRSPNSPSNSHEWNISMQAGDTPSCAGQRTQIAIIDPTWRAAYAERCGVSLDRGITSHIRWPRKGHCEGIQQTGR